MEDHDRHPEGAVSWVVARAMLGTVWGFLKSIPWQAWAFAAVVALAWLYGERRADWRETEVREEFAALQAAANDAQAKQEAKDAETAKTITADTTKRTTAAVVDTRTKTATAVERVRHETKTIVVPADCAAAVRLPDGVSREGREAIERANAADRPMRGTTNP